MPWRRASQLAACSSQAVALRGRAPPRGGLSAEGSRSDLPQAVKKLGHVQLWYANSYAIRGLFLRVHGNVRNVGFWDVTTEKRWGAAPRCMQAIKSHFPTLISPPLAPPPQKSEYGTHTGPYSPWQPYNRALRAKTLLAHMYIAAKALFRGGGTISALCYAPAAAD